MHTHKHTYTITHTNMHTYRNTHKHTYTETHTNIRGLGAAKNLGNTEGQSLIFQVRKLPGNLRGLYR